MEYLPFDTKAQTAWHPRQLLLFSTLSSASGRKVPPCCWQSRLSHYHISHRSSAISHQPSNLSHHQPSTYSILNWRPAHKLSPGIHGRLIFRIIPEFTTDFLFRIFDSDFLSFFCLFGFQRPPANNVGASPVDYRQALATVISHTCQPRPRHASSLTTIRRQTFLSRESTYI